MATSCRPLHMARPAIQASISQRLSKAISDAGVAITRQPDLGGRARLLTTRSHHDPRIAHASRGWLLDIGEYSFDCQVAEDVQFKKLILQRRNVSNRATRIAGVRPLQLFGIVVHADVLTFPLDMR
jgi:hypothetical protein